MSAAPRNIIIGILASAALLAGGLLTGQRLWKTSKPGENGSAAATHAQNAGKKFANREAANTVANRIRAQEGAVERSRKAMQDALKKRDAANRDRAGKHKLALEKDLLRLSTQLETLKNLNGDEFFNAVMAMGSQDSTIQKVYPEYQAELTTMSSISRSGFGPRHPKVLGLKESIRLKSEQLEAAAENLEASMNVQIESGHRMLADAAARSSESSVTATSGDTVQNDYTAAKKRYESELEQLENLRAQGATGTVSESGSGHRLPESDRRTENK